MLDLCVVIFYYNRVVRECHVSGRRDRKPGRIPVKKLKRLSQKSEGICVEKYF